MIPVQPKPEYPAFHTDVRVPGISFLRTNPNPSSRDFRAHRYWSRAKRELHDAYLRCAYTSRRLWGDDVSVDHFLPKAKYPQFAYEWDNYRLAQPKLNGNKADSEEVLDPFQVRTGWFVLDCPSCLVFPGDNLNDGTRQGVDSTIRVLKLNSYELSNERFRWLAGFAQNQIPFDYLEREDPFLATEIKRQGITNQLATLFSLN